LRYGLELQGVTETTSGVRATFTDGTHLEGEFLVGADGLRSTTRPFAVPKAPAPVFSGLLDFGGFTRVEGLPFPAGINQMVFGRRAFFGAFTTPTGETWWFHNGPPGEGAHRARLLELHRDDPAWVRQLIESTPSLLGPWGIHDLHAMPRWTSGRVCLIGDAAHAMSPSAGQGASLAMEDAMVLAQCIRDVPDVRAAFVRFEQLRRPRVDAIFKEAQRQSSRKAPTPLSEWFRDRMLPFFLKFGAAAQTKSYAFRIDWDERIVG
jgi:2-polyprenyl-6-methoxyphenol hydroxylase-like FAD-dependent oxidoreductase